METRRSLGNTPQELNKQQLSSDEDQVNIEDSGLEKCKTTVQASKEDVQNVRQYIQYFKDVEEQKVPVKSRLRYIKSEQTNFYTNLTIFNVQHSKNFEIVVIQLRLGSFSTKINIINRNQRSPFHSCRSAGFGSFGDVYTLPTNSLKYKYYERYAIKCFPIKAQEESVFQLKEIMKQIFIMKLTNEIDEIYSSDEFICFDLVYYRNCLQLSMLKLDWNQNIIESRENDLKKSLRTFHKLGLIHCDIKKENIAYNSHIGKWVFIDFGLSFFIKEKFSEKTQTRFIGNFRNASPEMKKISKDKTSGSVNLYFNDYYGLIQTVNDFKSDQSSRTTRIQDGFKNNLSQSILQQINFFLIVVKMKYYLYVLSMDNQKICQLFLEFRQRRDEEMSKLILDFMSQVKVSTVSKAFFDTYVKQIKQIQESLWFILKNQKATYVQEESQFESRFTSLLQNEDINVSIHFNSNNIQAILLDQQKLRYIDKQLYFSNILTYISYTQNKYKKTTPQKSLVCQVFNRIYSDTNKYTREKIYSPLHSTINFILNYCLTSPFTHWKKNYLFKVITQWLILGLGCDEKIEQLIIFFQNNSTSSAEQAFMLYLLYEHFVWDNNILIKSEGKEIQYTKVISRLNRVMINIGLQFSSKDIQNYAIERLSKQKLTKRSEIQKDLLIAVEYIANIGLKERFDSMNTNTMKIINLMLKITSTDPFVHLYGQEIFRTYLNFAIKVIDSSFIRSKEIFKTLVISEENQGQIKYYYFNIINALKKLKESSLALNLLKKWKRNINDNDIWQNSMIHFFLAEQMNSEQLQNPQYAILIRNSLAIINISVIDSIRSVLNLFKSIQIFTYISFNMSQKQYLFIKNKCRINYYDFISNYQNVITFPNMRKQLIAIDRECQKYFVQFQKVLDWITFRYLLFIKRKLFLCIQLFGKYLGVPFIMKGYNFFHLYLKCTQVFNSINNCCNGQIQNNNHYFLNFLIEVTKRKESMDQIIKKYEALRNDFPAQLLILQSRTSKNFFTDKEYKYLIYNIDFLLLRELQLLTDTTEITYKSYLIEIILKVNIAILIIFRKYDKIGDCFPKKQLQSLFFKKFFNIQLQLDKATLYKKQIIALYIQYLGNLYSTFYKLLPKVEAQNIDVTEHLNYIQTYFTQKIMLLKQILYVTKSYCLIRYFNVLQTCDILFFRVLISTILQMPKKIVYKQVIECLNIMSEVNDNKESWRHFFWIKELFQLDHKFNEEQFIKFIKIVVQLRWGEMMKVSIFNNNYRLWKFVSTLVCSLIDCLLSNQLNNLKYLIISPILELTSFQCVIVDHPLIIQLIRIEQRFLKKLNLKDRLQIFPFLLMIAIQKIEQINSSRRFKAYLQKKMIKGLIINDCGNLFITYCKNYLKICQKIHREYFKNLCLTIKDTRSQQKRFMKMKLQKYYPSLCNQRKGVFCVNL